MEKDLKRRPLAMGMDSKTSRPDSRRLAVSTAWNRGLALALQCGFICRCRLRRRILQSIRALRPEWLEAEVTPVPPGMMHRLYGRRDACHFRLKHKIRRLADVMSLPISIKVS